MRKPTPLSILSLVALATVLVGSWLFVRARERSELEARLETTSRQVAARLEQFLRHHTERIRVLGSDLLLEGSLTEDSFREISSRYQESNAGLQALNFVRADGVIAWVEPEAPNRAARGFDLTRHPIAADALLRARETPSVTTTPPLELLQGGWGLAAYYALRRNGETLGFLNAVFRLPDLLEECLRDERDSDELYYLLRAGDDLLGALGPRPDDTRRLPVAQAAVPVSGRSLTLSVLAPPRWVAANATWVDEALLATGLLLAGAVATLVHVDQRRRNEAELAARRFRVLVENSPDAIVAIDAPTGTFVNGNRRAYRLFGLDPERFEGLDPADASPELQPDGRPSRQVFAGHVEEARAGGVPVFEWALRDAEGGALLTEVHLVALPDPGRELVRASFTDVTRRHELERELRRTQAHEAMGRLAGCVAHDFNNLLTAILGAAGQLEASLSADASSRSLAREIIDSCERAGRLTHQLLAFSRHSALKPRAVDLNGVVSGLVPVLGRVLGTDVRLETRLESRHPVFADPSQIELALLNLTVNARDAMAGGGRVTIATRDFGGEVELAVADEGQGIPEEIRERVFEPFFTTKGPDLGTGIGLATVQQIAERADARVSVESAPGAGATFRIAFPAHPGSVAPQTAVDSHPPRRAGAVESALVVEDDDDVRAILQRSLEAAGYRVVAARDAEQALAAARETAYDLLVADVVLPGQSGASLAGELRRLRPGTAVLLVSGYADGDLALDEVAGGPFEILNKPFSPPQLLAKVQDLLLLAER